MPSDEPALPLPADDALPAPLPPTEARSEILRLHRSLFLRQKQLIARRVSGYSRQFRLYERRYERRVQAFERVAPLDEVVREAAAQDVVYVGDYHTLKQSQRAFVKLASRLAERGRPIVLALEFVHSRAQAAVDRFLRGRIGEKTFLERIGHERQHAFDLWPNFRPIFEAARTRGWPVVALERPGGGGLELRDRHAAKRIAQALEAHPGALVLVLAGQLHCAPGHLPQAVQERAGERPVRTLVIYQNAESIYWELERRGLAHAAEAVRVREGEYCLINTSPVVAQKSFLDWVEGDGEPLEAAQAEAHFREVAQLIAAFLELPLADALDAVEVRTPDDLAFVGTLRSRGFSAREIAAVRRQILSGDSLYLPRARIAYLADLSINHAAEEAAHFLRHVATGQEDVGSGLVDQFYGVVMEEALAFFGSKIANPRRKAPQLSTFERLRRGGTADERRLAELVLAHKALELGRRLPRSRRRSTAADTTLFQAVTHALGYMLGERLYDAMLRGQVSKDEARALFVTRFDGEGEALLTYFRLARELR